MEQSNDAMTRTIDSILHPIAFHQSLHFPATPTQKNPQFQKQSLLLPFPKSIRFMFLQNSIAMEHSHKAGSLKQSNKSHKQVKNSKRATKLSMGGRVEGGGRLSIKEKWEEDAVR